MIKIELDENLLLAINAVCHGCNTNKHLIGNASYLNRATHQEIYFADALNAVYAVIDKARETMSCNEKGDLTKMDNDAKEVLDAACRIKEYCNTQVCAQCVFNNDHFDCILQNGIDCPKDWFVGRKDGC